MFALATGLVSGGSALWNLLRKLFRERKRKIEVSKMLFKYICFRYGVELA